MTATNRATLLNKIHKVLKKHYKPADPPAERSILEHLLYGCCLENARPEAADEAFARLQQSYFDWNEVRVTTVNELSEQLSNLPRPNRTAQQLKRALQSVFEAHFAFDLEQLGKQNLGKSEKDLEKYAQGNPFLIAYVVQHGLGGHAIPCCQGVLDALVALAALTPAEAAKLHVPGIERAIPKNKGLEFASLLHQLGADFAASPPFSQRLRGILIEIDPDSKDRLPKRQRKDDELSELPPPAHSDKEALVRASLEKAAAKPLPHAKDAHGKDASSKESPGKESPGKEFKTKDAHSKESAAKESHSRSIPAKEIPREHSGRAASKDAREAKGALEGKKKPAERPDAKRGAAQEPPRKPIRTEGKHESRGADKKGEAKKLAKKKPR